MIESAPGIDCSLVEWNVVCNNNGHLAHDITTFDNGTLIGLQYVLGCNLVGCSCTRSMHAHHVGAHVDWHSCSWASLHISALPLSCVTVNATWECKMRECTFSGLLVGSCENEEGYLLRTWAQKMGEYTSTLLSHSLGASLSFVQLSTPPHPALPGFCVPPIILPTPL